MKVNNPYSEWIKLMQQHGAKYNPPTIQLGEVISTSPLAIKTGDIQLNKSNLLIADYLNVNYSRQLQVNGSSNEYITQDGFSKGDTVALIQISSEKFLVFCKAVEA